MFCLVYDLACTRRPSPSVQFLCSVNLVTLSDNKVVFLRFLMPRPREACPNRQTHSYVSKGGRWDVAATQQQLLTFIFFFLARQDAGITFTSSHLLTVIRCTELHPVRAHCNKSCPSQGVSLWYFFFCWHVLSDRCWFNFTVRPFVCQSKRRLSQGNLMKITLHAMDSSLCWQAHSCKAKCCSM